MILAKAVLIEVILIFRDVATDFAARARLRALGASLGRAMLIKIDPGSQVTLGQRVRFGHGTIVSVQREEFTDGVSSLDTLVVGDDTMSTSTQVGAERLAGIGCTRCPRRSTT